MADVHAVVPDVSVRRAEAVPFNAFYLWQQLLPQQLVRVLDELA